LFLPGKIPNKFNRGPITRLFRSRGRPPARGSVAEPGPPRDRYVTPEEVKDEIFRIRTENPDRVTVTSLGRVGSENELFDVYRVGVNADPSALDRFLMKMGGGEPITVVKLTGEHGYEGAPIIGGVQSIRESITDPTLRNVHSFFYILVNPYSLQRSYELH